MRVPLARLLAFLQSLPLRRRLSILIAVCAGITALLCLLAVVGSGLWLQSERAREETDEVVRTLSFALEAPVAFGDRKGIADALTLLRARPGVSGAWVYDEPGQLLASYGSAAPRPPSSALVSGSASRSLLELAASQDILNESGVIGRVVIVNRLSRLWQSLGSAMLAIVVASAAGLLLSVLLAQRIAAAITRPIDTLADASRAIARHHDYARRLPDGGHDEIGTATAAFNEMLDEIGKRGEALIDANRQLERRVGERTLSLQREKERAEAASVAKTRFLANMSHELRTPLNAVIGAAQLLQDGRDDEEGQARLVNAIRGSSGNLLSLIDNILDLARIETGALELLPEDFSLVDCLEAAMATASVSARIKGLTMTCIVDPDLPEWRYGDPMRLRQVLLNLLGNAVKFTLEGGITLHAQRTATPGGFRISVTDSGIGIGKASLAQVFEPFRQADDAANRRFGGSGLGLAISRQLVEAMDGRIDVSSELGKGSRFEIELGLPDAHDVHLRPPPMPYRVAYFEPHEDSAAALAAHFTRLGCEAQRCFDPQDLQRAEAAADGVKPWVLIALDAPESAAFLERSMAWIDAERVIGMAATDSPTAETARRRYKTTRNLIKPVLRSALVSRLGSASGSGAVKLPKPLLPLRTAQELEDARHVLVVEDDPTNQMIVCGMLHNAGYRTSVAGDGTQALAMLGQHLFDVVLMDWQMPDLDGLEVTRQLRAGVAGRFAKVVPIIALTANAFAEDRIACLSAGMNDFLTKPVLSASLIATIQRWTNRPGGDEEAERSSAFGQLI